MKAVQSEVGGSCCKGEVFRFRESEFYPGCRNFPSIGDGKIAGNTHLKIGSNDLPDCLRLGRRLELPVNLDNLKYFGRGPQENYIDRNSGEFLLDNTAVR